jgi:hypothetical protein
VISLAAAVGLAGCGAFVSAGKEGEKYRIARLEREAQEYQQAIAKLETESAALRTERDDMRRLLAEKGIEYTPETVPAKPFSFDVTSVGFSFLTCAVNLDRIKGDDGVAAYVHIYDQFDSSMKAAGAFRFDLFDLAVPENQLIESWSFEPEAAAKFWQDLPGCYRFKLPFTKPVEAKKVMLKVTFHQEGKKDLTATRELPVEQR